MGGNGPDGGVDVELRRGKDLFLVQCKHWRDRLGVRPVRELFGLVAAQRATGGFVICSGSFTEDAVAFARTTGLQLYGPSEILKLFQTQPNENFNVHS